VPATWDQERQQLCCVVPKDVVVPDVDYEVIDADGKVVCKSTAETAIRSGGTCCNTKTCDKAEIVQGCNVYGNGIPASGDNAATGAGSVLKKLSWLDRLLPVWIILAMVLGVLLGYYVPTVKAAFQVAEIGGVSLPIALGLWIMMLPVLTKVQYELLGQLLRKKSAAKQFSVSFVLNWVIGPALMTGLAWACLPDLPGYRNGVIMVGLARCIAMVLIWNEVAQGNRELCGVMVAFNSVLQIVLYTPLSIFYLQVVSGSGGVHVSFWNVAKSVLLFLGVPLVAGVILRYGILLVKPRTWLDQKFLPYFSPLALLGLLYTIIVLFANQGYEIVSDIGAVCRVAVPMLIYFVIMFAGSFTLSWRLHMPYDAAVTQAFTAASNNFELAIAVAVGAFGVQSQEALAATVGPLIEVPVLLGLVYVALWLKGKVTWGPAGH